MNRNAKIVKKHYAWRAEEIAKAKKEKEEKIKIKAKEE